MTHEILTNDQMARADRLTIESGVAGYTLMQKAAAVVVEEIQARCPETQAVHVLCGPGNNGGDGFVMARMLKDQGWSVRVACLVEGDTLKGDAARAFKDWEGPVTDFESAVIDPDELVVDALFGTGFKGGLPAPVIAVFKQIVDKGPDVLAVDIPSGVNGNDGSADPHSLHADLTVTFFRKKLGHILTPGLAHCGIVVCHDIGISGAALEQTGFAVSENNPDLWRHKLPYPPAQENHKYSRGHVLMLGGAPGMTGAIRMAAQAAMRMGAGLCTVASVPETDVLYQSAAPHILSAPMTDLSDFKTQLNDSRRNVVLIGPGAGFEDKVGLKKAVLDILEDGRAVVLDADALSVFADEPETLHAALHENCVITPHEGEFARLFPEVKGHKLARTEAAAVKAGCTVLLKGADTVIAHPDGHVVINIHASPWLATAGAGDVLAGMIAGLMAQGMPPYFAAKAAVWIHGEAALRFGSGLTAPDIIEEIPCVLQDFA